MNFGIYHKHSLFLKHLDVRYTQMVSSLKFHLNVVLRKLEQL